MATLVTGGTGFIGGRLIEYLLQQGETIHVLDLAPETSFPIVSERVRYFSGNIMNRSDVERAMIGCTHVYHLAAYARNWSPDERTFFNVNVGGTGVVLETALAMNVKRVVHTSSNVALGPSDENPLDESAPRQTEFFTPYEHSKFLSEQLVRDFVRRGLDVVIVNPTRVYGPGPLSESNSVTKMIEWYLEGKWRVVLGSGEMVGNYVFVDDLVDGYTRAMKHGTCGERYILGGENVSFNGFFATLASISRQRRWMVHLPDRVALLFSRFEEYRSLHSRHYPLITPGWAKTFLCNWANSCRKAETELGYTITPFATAMEKTIEWLN
jgi:NAD+-dependent farnesol dehydrogenase